MWAGVPVTVGGDGAPWSRPVVVDPALESLFSTLLLFAGVAVAGWFAWYIVHDRWEATYRPAEYEARKLAEKAIAEAHRRSREEYERSRQPDAPSDAGTATAPPPESIGGTWAEAIAEIEREIVAERQAERDRSAPPQGRYGVRTASEVRAGDLLWIDARARRVSRVEAADPGWVRITFTDRGALDFRETRRVQVAIAPT